MIILKKTKKTTTNHEKYVHRTVITLEVIKSAGYFFLACLFLGGALALGIGLGYFAQLVSKTEIPTKNELVRAINDVELLSKVTYADGQEIAELRSDIVRIRVESENISPLIKNALISTEDEYFNTHSGIVPKALIRATISDITGLGGQSGGSTVTQQLVKQQLLTNEVSFSRKANEILFALRVEKFLSKDDILTAYLNVSPFGRNNKGQNIAGVEAAAQGLFGKSAKDVNLSQAAFIAGLPQSPIIYSPYDNTGEIKKDLSEGLERKNLVLSNMYRAKLIDKKEFEEASKYDLSKDFLPQSKAIEQERGYLYYYVEAEAIKALMNNLYTADNLTKEEVYADSKLQDKYYQLAERNLRHNGYTITTTINKDVYNAMNNAAATNAWMINDWSGNTIQNGSVLLENSTGKILGFIGGLGYENNQLNHAFQAERSPGSTMKPILAYAPAIDVGLIGSESMLADYKRNYRGTNTLLTNYGGTSSESFVPVRNALKNSANIPVVNLYEKLREVADPESYFKKMNISMSSQEFAYESIPLGATDTGLSVYEQTNAYQTLANGGKYIEGYVIQTIKDSSGKVVYENKSEPVEVYKATTASIMNDLMRDVLNSGTATVAKNSLASYSTSLAGADWVGKTGTSEADKDFWFTASTPGVTLSSWIGKSDNKPLPSSFGQNNMQFWAAIANAAYQVNAETFKVYDKFKLDLQVKTVNVSNKTGTKPGSFTYDNKKYSVPGSLVKSYYIPGATEPEPTYDFAIGAEYKNYQSFWSSQPKNNTNTKRKNDEEQEKKKREEEEKKNEEKEED